MSPAETQRRRRIARKAAQQALANLGKNQSTRPFGAPWMGDVKLEACDAGNTGWHVYVEKMENGGFLLQSNGKNWFAKDHDDLKEVFIEAMVRGSVSKAL